MRMAEYKKIDERTEEYTVTIPAEYDEDGNVTIEEHEEICTRTVPVMGMVYRDMTPEEAEMNIEIPAYEQIRCLKDELATYDYIGVKIAMGVATKEDYAEEINYTETLRQKIRELESE